MAKSFLSIERLTQKFPDGAGGTMTVFENATFGVEKGEFVCILGHSGCGKSTIMNILAGLAEPTSGVVKMDGEHLSGPSLDRGVVFQNYSLLPWLSALKNVTFAVAARFPDWTKQQVVEHSTAFLEKVGLTGDTITESQANCQVACANGYLSRGLLPMNQSCCCLMSHLARWMH